MVVFKKSKNQIKDCVLLTECIVGRQYYSVRIKDLVLSSNRKEKCLQSEGNPIAMGLNIFSVSYSGGTSSNSSLKHFFYQDIISYKCPIRCLILNHSSEYSNRLVQTEISRTFPELQRNYLLFHVLRQPVESYCFLISLTSSLRCLFKARWVVHPKCLRLQGQDSNDCQISE